MPEERFEKTGKRKFMDIDKTSKDSFDIAEGLAEKGENTLEWIPAYYCELDVLKTYVPANAEHPFEVALKKKTRIFHRLKDVKNKEALRYTVSDIREGNYRSKMQEEITAKGFECQLPNEHVRFAKKNCFGKIIAEKIPRDLYFFDKHKKATIKFILVQEHERALFIRDGKVLKVFDAGKHDIINQSMEFNVIDIFYVDVGNITTRWGTSTFLTDGKGTMTATQARLRINGNLIVRINNVSNFLTNIVKTETEYFEGNIENYVKDKVIQTVNSEMSQAEPISVYQDAEKVLLSVKVKANDLFKQAGIEIVDLSIMSVRFDDDVEQMFKDRLQKIKVGGATADADTERKLQELKRLKEIGIDVKSYVEKEQEIKMAGAGGISEKEKIKIEIKDLEKEIKELDEKLDSGIISETVWKKRMDRCEKKLEELKRKL